MKPKIGIVGNITYETEGVTIGEEKIFVMRAYVDSIIKAGGIPLVMPLTLDFDVLKEQVESVDGIVITGGQDINPLIYNEEPIEKQGGITPDRDWYDIEVIKYAFHLKKPLLGICRGIQAINVALGGNLYQDLSQIPTHYIKHSQKAKPDHPTHSIDIAEGSRLYYIFGKNTVVNSFHHQAVKRVAKGFKAVAWSKDGVVEAIEAEDEDYFAIGVQWHPELMASKGNENMLKLFKEFIKACEKRGNKK
ncbi:gamma-glutamyl-gamma-aminobutyrate hydrolase family protein [Caldanaerobacter sp.]|uniref:gamma-glutamyl-gamma-aminobutyrate hydrolase family protein n=1 Tax=Caldanaerobacter sp. TaxID=2930036 RepID=UPI003C7218E1